MDKIDRSGAKHFFGLRKEIELESYFEAGFPPGYCWSLTNNLKFAYNTVQDQNLFRCGSGPNKLQFVKMTEFLANEILTLRPANVQDKRKIFDWATNSNLTSEMFGLPNFPDSLAPTWDEFDDDYTDHYFDDSQPLKGRCFIIEHNGQEIGQINYNEIDPKTKATELDIWLADKQFTRKGFGTEAIKMLCRYLDKSFGSKTIYIAPSKRNEKAIRAYKKAGFSETKILPGNFIPDYDDTVLMIKKQ